MLSWPLQEKKLKQRKGHFSTIFSFRSKKKLGKIRKLEKTKMKRKNSFILIPLRRQQFCLKSFEKIFSLFFFFSFPKLTMVIENFRHEKINGYT